MYEIIFIINKACVIILLFGKISTPWTFYLSLAMGLFTTMLLEMQRQNDLPESQKITPRNRKSVFIKDFREVRKVEYRYFFLFWRHVLYSHGTIMWHNWWWWTIVCWFYWIYISIVLERVRAFARRARPQTNNRCARASGNEPQGTIGDNNFWSMNRQIHRIDLNKTSRYTANCHCKMTIDYDITVILVCVGTEKNIDVQQ